jgi:pyruvate,water dikinase
MTEIGNKAKNLQILKTAGFAVPDFIVLPPEYEKDSAKIKSALERFVKPNRQYAVRSSGTLEDTADLSFAGQYFTALNVCGLSDITDAVKKCYESIRSKTVMSYLKKNSISNENIGMAVVVQEMINGDMSGVAFSINPLSGADKEIVINVAEGLGDVIVSGQVTPEEYVYNWYDEKIVKSGELLDEVSCLKLANIVLKIQILFGYPIDIEFAIKNKKIYLLQARAITKILYEGIPDEWTTADFKDGGVSATVCTPFMWSLYEYIWEIAYRKFLTDSMFLDGQKLGKLGEMYFGRPYWNLTQTKLAMSQVPGYKEREFDEDLGVKPTYDGNGATTGITPKSLFSAVKILVKNQSQIKDRLKQNQSSYNELIKKYNTRLNSVNASEKAWQQLVFGDYLLSESTYFEQIFVNTVAQSIYKDKLLKHISKADYLKLLMGIDDISHLRPYYAMWRLSRQKRIAKSDAAQFLSDFGYHSDKELDVTYPHFAEEPAKIRQQIIELAKISDVKDPEIESQKHHVIFEKTLAKLPKKLHGTVVTLRLLLWWREELRDISTRFYYLIRLHTLALAKEYQRQGVLRSIDDIWFLKIADLRNFIQNKLTKNQLREILRKNRLYYDSFRNFMSDNEIGKTFDTPVRTSRKFSPFTIKGVGCSTGKTTGIARVIKDLSEIDRLQKGDILVTKFTDTGWTSKFAILGGIVTEYGGVLCHAAIVSREFGLPCVVSVENAMSQICDGETITINGATGEITKGEK